ncbi:MAG: hypothetical protein M0Z49_12085 [Chloroflexi bacterium]|nr:hypothetical protein [Chloroflexota bacterium]
MSDVDLVVVDVRAEGLATCMVCGQAILDGGGVTARFGDRLLRFKCPGCLSRFRADPERYLSGGPSSCCDDEHEHAGHGWSAAAETESGDRRGPSLRVIH